MYSPRFSSYFCAYKRQTLRAFPFDWLTSSKCVFSESPLKRHKLFNRKRSRTSCSSSRNVSKKCLSYTWSAWCNGSTNSSRWRNTVSSYPLSNSCSITLKLSLSRSCLSCSPHVSRYFCQNGGVSSAARPSSFYYHRRSQTTSIDYGSGKC